MKKTRQTSKLKLDQQTVRILADEKLELVAGGSPVSNVCQTGRIPGASAAC